MSIKYLDCEKSDCYYGYNSDRLNNCEDAEYVVNKVDTIYNLYLKTTIYPPTTIILCNIDADNSDISGTCEYCKLKMLDVFLKIDNINICALCMENVPHPIDFLDDTELESLENIYSTFEFDEILLKYGNFNKIKHINVILYTKIMNFIKYELEDYFQSKI